MSKEELVQNLGTIARSGSKAFARGDEDGPPSAEVASNIIGQFGVGFYSAFMVGSRVTVTSRSADSSHGPNTWSSEGSGTYDLSDADGSTARGASITIDLKEDALNYADSKHVNSIITKYSNFVNYPIRLNGDLVNTVQPLWTMDKSDVTDENY